MNTTHKHLMQKYPSRYFLDVLIAGIFISVSLMVNHQANLFAARQTTTTVGDVFIDRLPFTDVRFIFTQGALIFLICLIIAALRHAQRLPFLLQNLALFITIRAFFLTLTHLGPPDPLASLLFRDSHFPTYLSSGADYFFSGHTGLPFLAALIFWDCRGWRWLFLTASLIGAGAVLLGHIHYSIDVFAAFFITYGTFQLGKWLFQRDFHQGR